VLEVLVAAIILVFVVQATAALLLAAITQGTVSKRATDAAALSQRELEAVRDMPYTSIGSVSPRTETVGAHAYTVERIVTANDPASNMKRVRVVVTWNIRVPRTYVSETIFTNLRE
jgi:Tfp pilus assembly protein PilV